MVTVLVALVALQHIAFMILEIFLWQRPVGRRIFGLSESFASKTSAMAANQGLYNGFLAAGLIYGLMLGEAGVKFIVFLLVCIVIAGIFGGLTVNRRIMLVQSVPAALALLFVLN